MFNLSESCQFGIHLIRFACLDDHPVFILNCNVQLPIVSLEIEVSTLVNHILTLGHDQLFYLQGLA